MEPDFWHERWNEGRINFHQQNVNSRLQSLWPSIGVAEGGAVLVPLSGKSLDMLWLAEQGHRVVGVELSELAVNAFFSENNIPFTVTDHGNLQEFTGLEHGQNLRVFVGDIFSLTRTETGPLDGYFDRAALIALPPEMRSRYVAKLADLLPAQARGLLISLIYDPSKMQGPPFSITDNEVKSLYKGTFSLQEVAQSSGPERLGSLADRGLDTMEERVYRVTRQT